MRRSERGYWWIQMTKIPYINLWDCQAVKNGEKRFNNLLLIVPWQSGFTFAWVLVEPLFTFLHSSIQWLLTTSSKKKHSLIGLYLHVSQKLTEWAHMHYIFCLFPGIIILLVYFLSLILHYLWPYSFIVITSNSLVILFEMFRYFISFTWIL